MHGREGDEAGQIVFDEGRECAFEEFLVVSRR